MGIREENSTYVKGTPLDTKMLLDFPGHFFEQAIKALLCLILLALVGTIGAVVIQTFIDLGHCFAAVGQETELHHHFKQILVDVLTGLAIVEVYRTALAYFIEGRVKVTYLIDAVLVRFSPKSWLSGTGKSTPSFQFWRSAYLLAFTPMVRIRSGWLSSECMARARLSASMCPANIPVIPPAGCPRGRVPERPPRAAPTPSPRE
jgi:uncharacterized membrane protein (DUF373 family)